MATGGSWRLLRSIRPPSSPKVSGYGLLTLRRYHSFVRCASQLHAQPVKSPEMVQVEEQLTKTGRNIKFVDPISNLPREPSTEELQLFQERLGHVFSNRWLLRLALVHSSAAPETENSTLSWLGDSAMGLLVTEQVLAGMGPGTAVGQMARARELVVSRQACVRHARQLGLDRLIIIGQCLQGNISNNMLAELFEAVIGAVYVDGGLLAVRDVYRRNFKMPQPPFPLIERGELLW